ncbi:hypothetical protein P43SY_009974 [Pythium insidiosum]|uniref:Regulator of chromosome condensation (RCC1)-like protein n=1 Tax=Pythium insidiosum TaxID=114742 RepID=A0AAD5LWR6_PYTIN|nr:hypothetical protein P43SY_009974 [Pythium insidiosum]
MTPDGEHGILYVCDARGVHALDGLLGRRVRGVYGGYDQCVAVVDSGELEWPGKTSHRRDVLEQESVALGLTTQSVRVQQVAFGESHRVALALDGRVLSWGRRDATLSNGELGQVAARWHPVTLTPREQRKRATPEPQQDEGVDAEFADREDAGSDDICRPRRVHFPTELVVRKVACGSHHTVALTDKGDLYAWGRNTEGQLGHGAVTRSADANRLLQGMYAWPKYVGALLGRAPVTDVCCFMHALMVSQSGELYAWGLNTYGQLGLVDSTGEKIENPGARPQPVNQIKPSVRWARVFAGGYISAALSHESRLFTEDLTVRFVPLTEGRLPRGSLAQYDETTREIVCVVPKFSLPGDFAVEVAMNGKHFTTDGHLFVAYQRPTVTAVSLRDARLEGGERLEITVEGELPHTCEKPVLRISPVTADATSKSSDTHLVMGHMMPTDELDPDDTDDTSSVSSSTAARLPKTTTLAFTTPTFLSRGLFTTPPMPYPYVPPPVQDTPPPTDAVEADGAEAPAVVTPPPEPTPPPEVTLGPTEDVDIFVALDGKHFQLESCTDRFQLPLSESPVCGS